MPHKAPAFLIGIAHPHCLPSRHVVSVWIMINYVLSITYYVLLYVNSLKNAILFIVNAARYKLEREGEGEEGDNRDGHR
jgi:hypothetical protein